MPQRRSLSRTWSSTDDVLTHHPSETASQGRRDDVDHEASHGSQGRRDDANEDDRGPAVNTAGVTEDFWGWAQLAELEAICREYLVELVPCWTILPGEERR